VVELRYVLQQDSVKCKGCYCYNGVVITLLVLTLQIDKASYRGYVGNSYFLQYSYVPLCRCVLYSSLCD